MADDGSSTDGEIVILKSLTPTSKAIFFWFDYEDNSLLLFDYCRDLCGSFVVVISAQRKILKGHSGSGGEFKSLERRFF